MFFKETILFLVKWFALSTVALVLYYIGAYIRHLIIEIFPAMQHPAYIFMMGAITGIVICAVFAELWKVAGALG